MRLRSFMKIILVLMVFITNLYCRVYVDNMVLSMLLLIISIITLVLVVLDYLEARKDLKSNKKGKNIWIIKQN